MKELLEKILGQIKKTPSGVRAYEDLYHICLETQKTDIPLSVEYLKKLSDIIENRIPQSETDKELRSLFMLHKKVLLAAAPFDFESYLLYVEWEREPDKKFYVPRREVMHPVVQAMQDLIDDRLDLLTISMPPGTGKSTLGIHENKEFLQELLEDIIEIANELGITVNTRKTRICKLSEHWRFLQVQYSLTDTGRVIQKINPKRLTAMRRKMKKLAPKLTEKEFTDFYKSWFKNHYKIMSKKQRSNMDTLFNQLKEVTKCTLSPLPMAQS